MTTAFWFVFALVVFYLAGSVVIRASGRTGPEGLGLVSGAAVAFVAGLGAVSLQMFFYSLVSIPFGVAAITLPWVAAAALMAWFSGARSLSPTSRPPASVAEEVGGASGAAWLRYALLLVIASQVVYVFSYATLLPVNGWDAWAIWFLKARAFFVDGGVSPSFLTDPDFAYSHPDYPLLVPLSVAWVYTAVGSTAEVPAKLLWPVQFVSLLVIFNWGVSRATGHALLALLFTTLLSLTPVLIIHVSGVPALLGGLYSGDFAGYADLMLSLAFLASGVFLYLFFRAGDAPGGGAYLVAAALMLGIAAWTKNEGLTFAAIGCALVVAHLLVGALEHRRLSTVYTWVPALLAVCLFALPWFIYRTHLGVGSDLAGGFVGEKVAENTGRIGVVASAFSDYLFTRPTLYGLAWYAYPLSAAANWRGLADRPLLLLNILLVGQLAVYAVVYVMTPADLAWHIDKSMSRLVLHLTPLGLFITAVNVDGILKAALGRAGR